MTTTQSKRDTHRAARLLATAELERHGYKVSSGHPPGHIVVDDPKSGHWFWVHIKGNLNRGSWWAKELEPEQQNLFCILVVVNEGRFFILDQAEFNHLIERYRRTHSTPHAEGFNWGDALHCEDRWEKLPGWT